MDPHLVNTDATVIAMHAIACMSAFIAALVLSSAMRLNKGARSNVAWGLIALGLILIGLSEGGRLAAHLGYNFVEEWDHLLMVIGMPLVLLGAILYRRLLKKALS